jgi:hypothetical protein
MRATSSWSKSPIPLVKPPPPDHCHITALPSLLVTPPKNCAQVLVPRRQKPVGRGDRWLVAGR